MSTVQPDDEEVHDAEVVETDHTGREIEVVQRQAAPTLFQTDDPAEVISRASKVATELSAIIKKQGLFTNISGNEHVQVEAWQTCGSMLGVFPVESWTREVKGPDSYDGSKGPWGYESRYEAVTIGGAVVGAGVARCTRGENKWKGRDDFSLESMAQTRATSKALKAPLGWIVALAGYKPTPAEEMTSVQPDQGPPFGPAASRELDDSLRRALGILVGTSADTIVYDAIEHDAGGYIPRVAARAVVHAAAEYRKNNSPQEEASA